MSFEFDEIVREQRERERARVEIKDGGARFEFFILCLKNSSQIQIENFENIYI